MKLDEFGLPVTDAGDGGDTARNCWSYFIAVKINYSTRKKYLISKLDIDKFVQLFRSGELVRHPDSTRWWSDPKHTSRDQTLHAFTYLSWVNEAYVWTLFDAFKSARKWYLYRCQNGDPLWAYMNVIWRAENKWYKYPLVVLWDLLLIFSVMERCGWLPRWDQDNKRIKIGYDPDSVGDDLNLQMTFMQMNMNSPTRWFARQLYKWFRPRPYGDGVNNAHRCWVWYYRDEARNDLWLPDWWEPICKEWF